METMSTPGTDAARRSFPTIPRGEVIGRYENYLDAQKVVDYLADNDFPVATVSIIGNDLKLVERVRAKLTYPRVAAQGATQGATLGLFFGLLLVFFSQSQQLGLIPVVAAVLLGAVLFMLMSVINFAMQRGQRDFSSTRQVLPSTWDVIVDPAHAGAAMALAAKLPMNPGQAVSRPGWGSPTQPTAPTPPREPQDEANRPAPRPTAGYGDLADGRPRFGVRVDEQVGEQGDDRGEQRTAGEAGAQQAPQRPRPSTERWQPGADTATGQGEPDGGTEGSRGEGDERGGDERQ